MATNVEARAEKFARSMGILVVEQFAASVRGIVDQAAVLVHGRIALTGPPGDGVFERLSELGGPSPAAG